LFRVLLAYVVGTGLGILAALALYAIPSFGSAFKPWIDLFRSIPGTIAFPFFLGLLGIKGIRGEIAVSMPSLWVVFWITLFSVYRELLVSTSARLQYLREHGASLWFIFRNLHAYVLAKAIFGNARLCVSLALAVLVAMEMYASPNCGLGYYARFEQENNHYEELLVTIILAGGVGWALNKGLEVLEHWLVWW
jgi:ABC-type nitrate/sulfonate/bicarbonate transport system permease component